MNYLIDNNKKKMMSKKPPSKFVFFWVENFLCFSDLSSIKMLYLLHSLITIKENIKKIIEKYKNIFALFQIY